MEVVFVEEASMEVVSTGPAVGAGAASLGAGVAGAGVVGAAAAGDGVDRQ